MEKSLQMFHDFLLMKAQADPVEIVIYGNQDAKQWLSAAKTQKQRMNTVTTNNAPTTPNN